MNHENDISHDGEHKKFHSGRKPVYPVPSFRAIFFKNTLKERICSNVSKSVIISKPYIPASVKTGMWSIDLPSQTFYPTTVRKILTSQHNINSKRKTVFLFSIVVMFRYNSLSSSQMPDILLRYQPYFFLIFSYVKTLRHSCNTH